MPPSYRHERLVARVGSGQLHQLRQIGTGRRVDEALLELHLKRAAPKRQECQLDIVQSLVEYLLIVKWANDDLEAGSIAERLACLLLVAHQRPHRDPVVE